MDREPIRPSDLQRLRLNASPYNILTSAYRPVRIKSNKLQRITSQIRLKEIIDSSYFYTLELCRPWRNGVDYPIGLMVRYSQSHESIDNLGDSARAVFRYFFPRKKYIDNEVDEKNPPPGLDYVKSIKSGSYAYDVIVTLDDGRQITKPLLEMYLVEWHEKYILEENIHLEGIASNRSQMRDVLNMARADYEMKAQRAARRNLNMTIRINLGELNRHPAQSNARLPIENSVQENRRIVERAIAEEVVEIKDSDKSTNDNELNISANPEPSEQEQHDPVEAKKTGKQAGPGFSGEGTVSTFKRQLDSIDSMSDNNSKKPKLSDQGYQSESENDSNDDSDNEVEAHPFKNQLFESQSNDRSSSIVPKWSTLNANNDGDSSDGEDAPNNEEDDHKVGGFEQNDVNKQEQQQPTGIDSDDEEDDDDSQGNIYPASNVLTQVRKDLHLSDDDDEDDDDDDVVNSSNNNKVNTSNSQNHDLTRLSLERRPSGPVQERSDLPIKVQEKSNFETTEPSSAATSTITSGYNRSPSMPIWTTFSKAKNV